jgi:hypothetical protein
MKGIILAGGQSKHLKVASKKMCNGICIIKTGVGMCKMAAIKGAFRLSMNIITNVTKGSVL